MSDAGFFSDKYLQDFVASLFRHITAFVETGTEEGNTARWVGERFRPVFTCETNPAYLQRLTGNLPTSVALYAQNSPAFIAQVKDLAGNLPLFFLDAHWNEYWPLLDELDTICRLYQKAIIIVHDCIVPGRPNFWGCRGGGRDDGPLNDWSYIRRGLDTRYQWRLFYPAYKKEAPGWCCLFMNCGKMGKTKFLQEARAVF